MKTILISILLVYLSVLLIGFLYPFGCGMAIEYYGESKTPAACKIFVHKH